MIEKHSHILLCEWKKENVLEEKSLWVWKNNKNEANKTAQYTHARWKWTKNPIFSHVYKCIKLCTQTDDNVAEMK